MMVPMVPIKMKGRGRWFEFWAFVDSGATYSIFSSKEAEALETADGDVVESFHFSSNVKMSG